MAALNKYQPIPPTLTQPVKTWVEEEGPKVHEALSTPSRFDYQRAAFTQRDPDRDLGEAILRYQETVGKEALIDFSSKHQWTWDDVLEEADEALKVYEAAGQGARGAIRKLFRRIGDKQPMLSPWVELVPQNEYSSMLNGGLKLIFAAARRMSEKRTQIIEALQDMPETVELAYRMRKIFRSDRDLTDLAIKLHHALLDAIENMISWLLEKPRKKHLKAFFQVSQYGEIVDQQLRHVEKCVAALRRQVDILRSKNSASTAAALERLEPQVSNIRQISTVTDVRTREIQHSVSNTEEVVNDLKFIGTATAMRTREIQESVSNTEKVANDIKLIGTATAVQTREIQDSASNTEKAVNDIKLIQAAGLASQNGILRTLADQLLKANWSMKAQQKQIQHLTAEVAAVRERVPGQQLESYATRPQLLELLMDNPSTATENIHYVLRQGQGADAAPSGQVKCLLQNQGFQEWLLGRNSAFVFVNGNDEAHALDRITPFTVFCAMLSLGLENMQEAMSIHFYCGLHAGSNDSLNGPKGLLRSLIAQLLAQKDFDLRFIHSRQYFDELQRYETDHLCDTFQRLVWQLPANKVLFCLIDGTVFIDRSQWQRDLYSILQELRALADNTSPGRPIFKLLMTNARCTRQLRELVPPHNYLEIREDISFDESAITEQEVAAHILTPIPSASRALSGNRAIEGNVEDSEATDSAEDDDFFKDHNDSDIDDYEKWPV